MRFARNLGLSSVLVVLLGITFTISSGCGGGHHVISVMFSTAPSSSLQAGATASVAATVLNDSANKGVTWSCMPAGTCGSFNPAMTASGAMTTFTAPQAVPQGGSVTIIATSVADSTKTASAMVTITAPAPIAVTFGNPAPPASINISANAMIVANVANDPANKGVTWSCTPSGGGVPAGTCGTFAPAQTASGVATTFTAPANVPNTGPLLIITATSVADSTKSVSANVALSGGTESVTITQFPAQLSVATGGNAMFGATIANPATANDQVSWSCTPVGSCGSFNPLTTASSASTTYTAPANVPSGNQVNIIATSSNNVVSPSVVLTIFTAGSNNARLKGQYAFLLTGQEVSSNLPTVGSLVFDGNGNVTSGEFDQPSLQMSANNFSAIPATGTYGVGSDGRGSMTLSFSINGTPGFQMSFNFALTASNSHAVLVETDDFISASGSLDLQSAAPNFSASQITGGYSFALTGLNDINDTPLVRGGIFTADGTANLKNGTIDTNNAGSLSSTAFTGTFTAPDTFGRGTFTDSDGSMFTYYIVTPEVLRLVETDSNATSAGGSAYGQGSAASFTNASLSGNFVFGLQGQSSGMGTAVAGQFTTDGNGTFTAGIADSISADGATVNTAVALTNSTYSISGSPRGTVSIVGGVATLQIYLTDPKINLLDPNNPNGGGGALIIQNDSGAASVGLVIPQAANPASSTFTGNYVVDMTALQNQGLGVDFELDLSGQAAVTGGSTSGLADFAGTAFNPATAASNFDPPVTGGAINGSVLTADGSNPGHFTGTLTIAQPAVAAGTPPYFVGLGAGSTATNAVLGLSYYQATSTQLVFIQTDGGEVAIGFLEQQPSLGTWHAPSIGRATSQSHTSGSHRCHPDPRGALTRDLRRRDLLFASS